MPITGFGCIQRVQHVRWSGGLAPLVAPAAGSPGSSVLSPKSSVRRPSSGRAAVAKRLISGGELTRGLRVQSVRRIVAGRAVVSRLISPPTGAILPGLRVRPVRKAIPGRAQIGRLGTVPPVLLRFSPIVRVIGQHPWRAGRPNFSARILWQLFVPPAFELRQSIVAWLQSLANLTTIIGPRVYFEAPSQASMYPCLAVQITKREYGHNHSGPDGTSRATAQITALAYSEATAIAAVEVVRNNVDGFRGLQSGIAILRCFLGDEADGVTPPVDGSDQWIYQVALEYEIAHRV
jgi:hypothetical protein